MSGTARFEIPVQFKGRWRARKGYLRRFGVIDVELVTADEAEAPLAIRWTERVVRNEWIHGAVIRVMDGADALDPHMVDFTRTYRVFDGRLWEQATGSSRLGQAAVADMVRAGGWRTDEAIAKIDRHPFADSRYAITSAKWPEHGAYHPEAERVDEFRAEAETVRRRVERCIVVAGLLWRPSIGPVIQLAVGRDGPSMEFAARPNSYGAPYLPSPEDYFDPFDIPAAEAFVALHYGETEVAGNPPEHLDGVPLPPFDPYPVMAETLADSILQILDKTRLGELPVGLLAAVTALRRATAARWPEAEEAYASGIGLPTYLRKPGRGVSGAPPLEYLVGDVLGQCEGRGLPSGTIRAWRATYDRIRRNAEDSAALGDVDL